MACKVMQVCSRDGERGFSGYTTILFREKSRIVRVRLAGSTVAITAPEPWDRALPGMGLVSGDYSRWIA